MCSNIKSGKKKLSIVRYLLAFVLVFVFAYLFGFLLYGTLTEPIAMELHDKAFGAGVFGGRTFWKVVLFFVVTGFIIDIFWGLFAGFAIGGFTEVEDVKTVLPLGSVLYILMVLLFLDVGGGLDAGIWGIVLGIVYNFGMVWGFLVGARFAIAMGKRWRNFVTMISYAIIICAIGLITYFYVNHMFPRKSHFQFLNVIFLL